MPCLSFPGKLVPEPTNKTRPSDSQARVPAEQVSAPYCRTTCYCSPRALLNCLHRRGGGRGTSLVSYHPHQPSTDRFNSWKLVTALIFKDLPGKRERVRNGFPTLLRRYSSIKEKKQSKIQTSSHNILLRLHSLLSDLIAG